MPLTDYSPTAARRVVEDAHARTQRLLKRRGFGEVTPVMGWDPDVSWLTQFVTRKVGDESVQNLEVRPEVAWFFAVQPGPECEAVILGLCRYPKTIRVEGKRLKVPLPGWGLRASCKTQYASVQGWEEFLRCHQLVIDVLRLWVRVEVAVEIIDEGEYWPGKNREALRQNLTQMNRAVAGLAGALKDAADEGGGGVESPIFSHPQFEQLEAEGASELGDKLVEAVRSARTLRECMEGDEQ